jgi:hypothetical protein
MEFGKSSNFKMQMEFRIRLILLFEQGKSSHLEWINAKEVLLIQLLGDLEFHTCKGEIRKYFSQNFILKSNKRKTAEQQFSTSSDNRKDFNA